MRFARRLDLVPPYFFAEIERRVESMRAEGVDVISLGIGDPDLPTPPAVVTALQEAVARPETHQYPSNRGLGAFREAVATFYAARFGVGLDPDSEVIPVLGGKEAVAHVAMACLDPGDVALAPDPGYPPYTSGPVFAGASVEYLPLEAENDFMPDLGAVQSKTASAANLLYFNYPNNPTGAVVAGDFFERAAAFAREHGVVAIHDSAYTEIAFDGYRPPSFLAAPGAKEVGAEIFSLSKGWNMTGWRIGWIAGNAEIVERYRQLKTNLDSGLFDALQLAGIAALTEARAFPQQMSEVYRRRRDLMMDALATCGIAMEAPKATPYLWVRVPEGHDSASFTELVLEQSAVVVSPGRSFGLSGEGYIRISLTVPDDRLEEAAGRIASSLTVESRA